MKLPLKTDALFFMAGQKAKRDDDGWSLVAAVAGPDDVAGQVRVHFDSDPGIQPGPFALESAMVNVPHISAATVRQAPRQEPS